MRLEDRSAPYKGVWSLTQRSRAGYEAIHHTFHDAHHLGCEIERRHFESRNRATEFVRHLTRFGWTVMALERCAEHFWYGLPDPAHPSGT